MSDDGTRLNKYLASCGVGSRRACDALVQEGRVEINGQPCLNPAERVQAGDFVRVDGKRVQAKRSETIVLHKPRGLVCSRDDERGRDTIYALLPGSLHHLHHVGRLDLDSEGLLVLTTDGRLSQDLLHPSKAVEKEYLVTANQPVADEHLDPFLSGIFTEEGKLVAKEIERLSPRRFRIVLTTGHKRQIRVMFQTLGYRVERLLRIRIGSLELEDLPPGKWRPLSAPEIDALFENPSRRKRQKARRTSRPPARKTARKTARKSATKRARPSGGKPPRSGSGITRPGGAKKRPPKRKF